MSARFRKQRKKSKVEKFKKKCQDAIGTAKKIGRPVTFIFNNIYITAGGESSVTSLMRVYLEKLDAHGL